MRARAFGAATALALACAAAAHATGAATIGPPLRVELLGRAQAELVRGDTAAALDDFERAAMMRHAADAELGLIRAALQDGQYRRALAFCAHTAGEHTDVSDGGALYAWLLRAGGQTTLAARVLEQTLAQSPGAVVATAVASAFAQPLPVARAVLLDAPHRMAPWPVMRGGQPPVPAAARFAGNAVLVGDGATALVPIAAIDSSRPAKLWLRNGLGQTTGATVVAGVPALAALGLAMLRLETPLEPGASVESHQREPFAGSPGYAVAFAATREPAWPWLSQGFLGAAIGATGLRRLGFAAPGAQGAPVLDAAGRLAGITLRAPGGDAAWLPATAWQQALSAGAPPAGTRAAAPVAHSAPDEVYESGLRRALQLLVVDAPATGAGEARRTAASGARRGGTLHALARHSRQAARLALGPVGRIADDDHGPRDDGRRGRGGRRRDDQHHAALVGALVDRGDLHGLQDHVAAGDLAFRVVGLHRHRHDDATLQEDAGENAEQAGHGRI